MNCPKDGSFIRKLGESDDYMEPEVNMVWKCPKCGFEYHEHLYFKERGKVVV